MLRSPCFYEHYRSLMNWRIPMNSDDVKILNDSVWPISRCHPSILAHFYVQRILNMLKIKTGFSYLLKVIIQQSCTSARQEGIRRSRGRTPRFLDFENTWRWVVSFTLRQQYPRSMHPQYPSNKSGWAPESICTILRREKPFFSCWGSSHDSSIFQPAT
jgi:hypothetical protein